MSLRELRTLIAIAQHGSFVRAAEAVHLTQSAVSLHVRALEEEFNAALFDRSRRVPVLTDAGLRVVERAREIVAIYDGIAAELGDCGELTGRLRLGAVPTALAGVLPGALAALNRAHPRLRVQVASGMSAEMAIRIEAGDLDAAITTEPVKPYPYGLVSTPLYEEGFWVIGPPAAKGHDARSILLDYPFIRFDRRAWAGRTIDAELRRQRLRVQTSMELDSQHTIIQMVASGLGAAVIPLAQRDIEKYAALACVPFGDPQRLRRVVLLEREDRPAGRFSAVLAAAIREQAGFAD